MNSSFHPSLFCFPLPDPLYPRINQPSVTSSSFSPRQPPIHTLYLLFYTITQAYTHKASYPLSDLDSLALQGLFFAYSVFQSHLLSPSFTVCLYIVRPCSFLLFFTPLLARLMLTAAILFFFVLLPETQRRKGEKMAEKGEVKDLPLPP